MTLTPNKWQKEANKMYDALAKQIKDQQEKIEHLEQKLKQKEEGELIIGQNLFETLKEVTGFTALEDDMWQIINAIKRDNNF